MKRLLLFILTLTLTLAAVAPTQAGNKKQAKNYGHSGGYSRSVGPAQRQGGYSSHRTSYSAPRHSGGRGYRSYNSGSRRSPKHGNRVRYY